MVYAGLGALVVRRARNPIGWFLLGDGGFLAIMALSSAYAASSPHGCPGPSTPAVNARATRARSGRPATVTLPRTAALAISAPAPSPPSPGEIHQAAGRTRRCTPDSAARVKSETHHRSGPSVAVRETADGAHRPSWRPDAVRYASVDTATHRPTVTHRDTRRDKKKRPA